VSSDKAQYSRRMKIAMNCIFIHWFNKNWREGGIVLNSYRLTARPSIFVPPCIVGAKFCIASANRTEMWSSFVRDVMTRWLVVTNVSG
jgi:hypothetical protein